MRFCYKVKEKMFKLGLNIMFYLLLLLLVGWMIYPYTSFYYRKPIVEPFAMRLNVSSIELEVGESFHLYVVGPRRKAKFSTNDYKVIELSSDGTVRARRKGKALIKVKVGKKTLKCKVIVEKKK